MLSTSKRSVTMRSASWSHAAAGDAVKAVDSATRPDAINSFVFMVSSFKGFGGGRRVVRVHRRGRTIGFGR
jgi:hypothetical protein